MCRPASPSENGYTCVCTVVSKLFELFNFVLLLFDWLRLFDDIFINLPFDNDVISDDDVVVVVVGFDVEFGVFMFFMCGLSA